MSRLKSTSNPGAGLTPQQIQALAHLAAMTDEGQKWCMKVIVSIAEAHPRDAKPRPQLRLVVGGAA